MWRVSSAVVPDTDPVPYVIENVLLFVCPAISAALHSHVVLVVGTKED